MGRTLVLPALPTSAQGWREGDEGEMAFQVDTGPGCQNSPGQSGSWGRKVPDTLKITLRKPFKIK
jgi:hypothetical protein